jgi:hypothetical protein
MAKAKGLPDTIKLKIRLEVDRALYDRIVAQAKADNLPGTVEDVLTKCCEGWFKGWENLFAAKDNADEAAKGPGLVGLDGKPLITTPGGEA